jgi:hypothetical protein
MKLYLVETSNLYTSLPIAGAFDVKEHSLHVKALSSVHDMWVESVLRTADQIVDQRGTKVLSEPAELQAAGK